MANILRKEESSKTAKNQTFHSEKEAYSVYTFCCSNDNKMPDYLFDKPYTTNNQQHCIWTKYRSFQSKKSALKRARALYRSGAYDYVEIKKNIYDHNTQAKAVKTVAVFGETSNKPISHFSIPLLVALSTGFMAAAVAMMVLYFYFL